MLSNLWILWKTQDSRLWNLWTTLLAALSPQNRFVIIGPSQEPVHNCSALLESNRSAANIYLSSALKPLSRGSRFWPSSDFREPVASAHAVSTVAANGPGAFHTRGGRLLHGRALGAGRSRLGRSSARPALPQMWKALWIRWETAGHEPCPFRKAVERRGMDTVCSRCFGNIRAR